MTKTYETLKLEEKTYRRFKQIKKILELQNNREYSISEFQEFLLDLAKPKGKF